MGRQPISDGLLESAGAFLLGQVATAGNDRQSRVRQDRGHPPGIRHRHQLVLIATDHEDGLGQFGEPGTHRDRAGEGAVKQFAPGQVPVPHPGVNGREPAVHSRGAPDT